MSEKATTYLTIMTKHNLFSFLGLVGVESNGIEGFVVAKPISAVIKLDPREGQPILREFTTRGEAVRQYQEAVTTSLERGWTVIYRGRPLLG